MDNRIKSMLGLCKRARLLVAGELSCEKALQAKNAQLTIVATDASDNTREKFTNKSNYYNVPILIFSTKEELGAALGAAIRATIVVTDGGFAKKLETLITDTEGN